MRIPIFVAPLVLCVAITCVRGQADPADVAGGEMAPSGQQPVSLALEIAMPDYGAGNVEGTTALIGAIAMSPEMTAAGKVLRYGGFVPRRGGGGFADPAIMGGGLAGAPMMEDPAMMGDPAMAGGRPMGADRGYPAVIVPLIEGVDASLSVEDVRRDKLTLRFMIIQPHAKGKALLDAAAQRVGAALVEQPPLPQDELAKRTKEVGAQLGALEDKLTLLRSMAKNNATIGPEILKERIKAAELEKQRLEMDLAAQKVRGEVIAKQIATIKVEADEVLAKDRVLEQLHRAADLQQEQWERAKKLQEPVSAAELGESERKWMDAKIRIVEREEAVRQSTKANLLERLNDELATAMINQAEMETRLAMIRQQQPSIDLKAIDEPKLTYLTEQYRTLFRDPGALPPLYFELDKKLAELKRAKLALQVSDVKVTEGAKAVPVPSPGPR
ncbi:MAG: hypothetical protein WBD40_03415 [Tepidisphaeraceae bacterium]